MKMIYLFVMILMLPVYSYAKFPIGLGPFAKNLGSKVWSNVVSFTTTGALSGTLTYCGETLNSTNEQATLTQLESNTFKIVGDNSFQSQRTGDYLSVFNVSGSEKADGEVIYAQNSHYWLQSKDGKFTKVNLLDLREKMNPADLEILINLNANLFPTHTDTSSFLDIAQVVNECGDDYIVEIFQNWVMLSEYNLSKLKDGFQPSVILEKVLKDASGDLQKAAINMAAQFPRADSH